MPTVERRILLVEGRDDKYVLKNLLGRHNLPCEIPSLDETDEYDSEKVIIIDREGVLGVLEDLETRIDESDLARLGVVVDADLDVGNRWTSLRNILIKKGYSADRIPLAPDPNGTIIATDNKPTIGIWLMPNNLIPGMLEDFIGFLIPGQDALWDRAKDCVDNITQEDRRFPGGHLSKAYIHTWLAWQAEPGKPLGLAITAKYLDVNAAHARQLAAWAHRLFD